MHQHMFYVASDKDQQQVARLALCEVVLTIMEADAESLRRAADALVALSPEPSILWSAARKLHEGMLHSRGTFSAGNKYSLYTMADPLQGLSSGIYAVGYPTVAHHVLRSAIQQYLARHEKAHPDDSVHIAQMCRALIEGVKADCDRIQTLQLALKVARAPGMTACYPQLEAHYVCATAFNSAVHHLKSGNMPMAQSFMTLASELATSTKCKIITPDMCRTAVRQFSCAVAEV